MSVELDRLFYRMGLDTGDLKRGAAESETVLKRLDSTIRGFTGLNLAAIGLAGVGASVVALGKSSVSAAVEMEQLMLGLTAVAGSSEEASLQMARLREVAKLPGLGLQEAVQGSLNLQAVGFSATQAEGSLKAFGNALATVGRGRAELDGIILALVQMQAKGKVFAEEINQIGERLPQIRSAMQRAFGTANSEDLQKMGINARQFVEGVTAELAKLPSVAGGAANAFENLGDTVFQLQSRLGRLILPEVMTFVGLLSEGFGLLTDAMETQTEEMLRHAQELGTLQADYERTTSTLDGLLEQYNQLRAQLGNTKLSSEQMATSQRDLNRVVSQIVSLVPQAAAGFDQYTQSLTISEAAVRDYLAALKEQNALQERLKLLQVARNLDEMFRAYVRATGSVTAFSMAMRGETDVASRLNPGIVELVQRLQATDRANRNSEATTKELTARMEAAKGATDNWNQALKTLSGIDAIQKIVDEAIAADKALAKVSESRDPITIVGRVETTPVDRLQEALQVSASTAHDLLNNLKAIRLLEPPSGADVVAPAIDPKKLLADVRDRMSEVSTELRVQGEFSADAIAKAQLAAVDEILAKHGIAGETLIKTYTQVADVRLDLIEKLREAEKDAVDAFEKEEQRRIDVIGQSQEAYIQAQRERKAEAKSAEDAVVSDARRAAVARANLAKGLRDELSQIQKEVEAATTQDALMGLQERMRAYERANAQYIDSSQDLARRVQDINAQIIENRFAITREAVIGREEAFDRSARDSAEKARQDEQQWEENVRRRGNAAIQRLKEGSEREAMERLRFQRRVGEISLREYRDALKGRLSALEDAGKAETAQWRQVAEEIHQVNEQIERDTERLTEITRQRWLDVFEVVTNAARVFSEDIGRAFGTALEAVDILTDPRLSKNQRLAGELDLLARQMETNRDFEEQIDDTVEKINEARRKMGQPLLRKDEIPGQPFWWQFWGDPDARRRFMEAELQKTQKELDRFEGSIREKNQKIETAAEQLGSALETGLRNGLLGIDLEDAGESLTRSLDEMIFNAVLASAIASTPAIAQIVTFLSTILADGLQENEVGVVKTAREQILNLGAEIERNARQQLGEVEQQLGVDFSDLRGDHPEQRRQSGISVAIRNITQRQADELAIVLRASQSLQAQIEQNTRASAGALTTFLPSIEERLMMIEGGLGGFHEPAGLRDEGGGRAAELQLSRKRRARGR